MGIDITNQTFLLTCATIMVYHACISFTINREVQTMAKSLLFLHAVAIIYYGILNIFTRMLKMMKGCVQAMN